MKSRGQGLVEYALVLILVAVVVVVMLAILGPSLGNIWNVITGNKNPYNYVLENVSCVDGQPEIDNITINGSTLLVTYKTTTEKTVSKGFIYTPAYGTIDWSKSCP